MARVRIDEDIRICPDGQYLELAAGQIIDGPVAAWLAADSGCPVTLLDDEPAAEPPATDGQDGALSATLTADAGAGVKAKNK